MPYYEFCLIGGDGSRLSRERHPAADLETVWGRVFRMAELESKRGKQIHVLDDQGRIVIGIGAIAAALSAQRARAAAGSLRRQSDATPAAPYDCFVDGRGGQTSGNTKGDYPCWAGRARRKRLRMKEAFTLPKVLADRTGAMAKSRSLSWRLGVSTLVIVLPLVVFALIMVGWIAHNEREAEQNRLIGDAYAFADTVGRQINAYFLLSAALSHSRLLQHGDLTGFAEQARDTLAEAPGVKVIVSTPDGDPVLSIPPAPLDSPLLRDRAALVRRAIESRSAFLSDVNADPALPEANASIETPVFLDGKPVYEIGMLLSLKQFRDLMQRQNFPSNWLSGIVDRKGAFVARIPSEAGPPGTLASAEFRDATRSLPESTVTHNSIGGQKVVSAYAPVEGGWTVGVAADARGLGIGPSAFLLTSLLAALAMLGSLLLSYLNGRALTRRVRDLESKTKNVLTGAPIAATSTGVREFDGLSDALAKTSELLALRTEQHRHTEQELRSREEHFRLLADSVPQLVWTAGPDGRIEYTNALRERYGAIGRTDWEGIIHPDDRRGDRGSVASRQGSCRPL